MLEQDVRRFLEVLACGQPFEIRRKLGNGVAGRVYGANQQAAAVDDLRMLDGQQATACWVTLNGTTMQPGPWSSTTTKDADVHARRWLLVDVDPQRPKDTNATDAELAAARTTADAVQQHLRGAGWPQPVRLMSGNGWHLLWRVDLPADDGGLVRRVLQALAARFNTPEQVKTEQVKVDVANYNPARITKVAGTVARKGPHTPERPQRVARLLEVPDPVVPVPRELLEQVAADAPTSATAAVRVQQPVQRGARVPFPKDVTGPGRADAVAAWLEAHGVSIKRTQRKGSATWLYLNACPCSGVESDGASDLGVAVPDDGPLAYCNQHNRGEGLTWRHLRDAIDPRPGVQPSTTPASVQDTQPVDVEQAMPDDVRADLEVVVLQGMAQFEQTDPEQAAALEAISTDLPTYAWLQTGMHASVQAALEDQDGRRVTAALLRAKGVTGGTEDVLLEPVHPAAVLACVRELAQHHTDGVTRGMLRQVMQRAQVALEQDPAARADAAAELHELVAQHNSTTAAADVRMGAAVHDGWLAEIRKGHGAGLQGLATGVPWFDRTTDGLRGMMLLAGQPGCGKTNLALWLLRHTLQANPHTCCVFFSGELHPRVVYGRLLAQQADVAYSVVRKGLPNDPAEHDGRMLGWAAEQQQRVDTAAAWLAGVADRMLLHDVRTAADLHPATLQRVVRQAMRRRGCSSAFVVLDSFQAIGARLRLGERMSSDIERDNATMAAVQRLQAGLDQPVLCITEQNKAAIAGNTKDMASVRGSARLIYTPDWVATLADPKDTADDDMPGSNGQRPLVLHVAKARDGGQCGPVPLVHHYFTGNWTQDGGTPRQDVDPGVLQVFTEVRPSGKAPRNRAAAGTPAASAVVACDRSAFCPCPRCSSR
jgi:replicative DNA helicase